VSIVIGGVIVHTTKLTAALIFLLASSQAEAQNPVFLPSVEIDQTTLLNNCPIATDTRCGYDLKKVLYSGGDFWTTPFTPYDPATTIGDGYGEGVEGPRTDQRKAFYYRPQQPHYRPNQPPYRFLRMNGLDSQSCFECHNSIGSYAVDARGALTRKPSTVGGSAGSNSNAFINPLFPIRQTLFIRNPPAVFGSGYQQAIGEEMTIELLTERFFARAMAKRDPGKPFSLRLTAKGVSFGTFTTTYTGKPAKLVKDPDIEATCKAGLDSPESIGGEPGYTDDLRKLDGVSCDLVIRPLQWKGVASSLRHFVRDALDFHFSMQAFEKVALCDCDKDGKVEEVKLGNLTAMASFVAMMRPPTPLPEDKLSPDQKLGESIFFGRTPGSYQNMCASCHVETRTLLVPNVIVEWPTSPQNGKPVPIDRDNPDTWSIHKGDCPGGQPPPMPNACPVESSYSAGTKETQISPRNRGALVSPVADSQQLPIVRRFNLNMAAMSKDAGFDSRSVLDSDRLTSIIAALRAPIRPAGSVVGQDYVIPLTLPKADVTDLQLPRLGSNPDGSGHIDV
jgi:hypothetical protein